MCLGILGKVVAVNQEASWVVVEIFGMQNKVGIALVDEDVALGDYLMIHAGFAIGKINLQDAKNTFELWEEILLGD